jgi:polar amino acid transport system substrate-binding protein
MASIRFLLVAVSAAALAFVAAGCGGGGSNSSGGEQTTTQAKPAIPTPSGLVTSGKLVYCSDISYPPEEFYKGGKPVGSDIDIGAEVARRMGLDAEYDNTGFDGIIAALKSRKCDAIISGMNDTPERAKQVAFVDYLSVGQSLIAKKGALKVTKFTDLCGKDAGAQIATTNIDTLRKFSKDCTAAGKPAIKITSFKEDPLGVTSLSTGKIDTYESDSPPAAYYVAQSHGALEIVGPQISPIPVGIAVRKDAMQLKNAVQKAITGMYSDGTMKKILSRWQMSKFALKK